MKSRAAVAWEAGKPLVIEEVDVDGPKKGEVLLKYRRREFAILMLTRSRAKIPRVFFPRSWATRAAPR